VSKVVNNFGTGGALTVAPTGGVTVGSTVDGVTINGAVVAGPLNHPNTLSGTGGNDYIVGGDYRDRIIGGAGDDVLTGGGSHKGFDPTDVFVFHRGSGNDVITDFHGTDVIDITGYLRHGAVPTITDSAEGAVIQLDANDSITLLGVPSWQLLPTSSGYVLSQILVG
jgi:Ca2+-binding RTX toxin-like protein